MNLYNEDCIETLSKMQDDSVDSLITDPPAGISFMGKDWDHNKGGRDAWIAWMQEIMMQCIRVMKPGAYGLVWALPRTSHWTATALEDAGFEIRDVVTHLFGSGFPKSLNLGEGRGTALKPASEHWILVRKPISEKTVAANVLKHGTGGINIDACRIGTGDDRSAGGLAKTPTYKQSGGNQTERPAGGRFPANLVLDEEAAAMLDEQSGPCKVGGVGLQRADGFNPGSEYVLKSRGLVGNHRKDNGSGASRFFYVAKASKKDRNASLGGMPEIECKTGGEGGALLEDGRNRFITKKQNIHPTVKSTKLMEYLITLITPPNGAVLDPFMGSGSTGVAAKRLGFKFIGIEKDLSYFEIATKRMGL